MIHDFYYFSRRYQKIEDDFLELIDFIEITDNFKDPCYKVGGSKMMDFCIKVGTEIETLFRILLNHKQFDSVLNIENLRKKQNITAYIKVIEPTYNLSNYRLIVNLIDTVISPYEDFENSKAPEWFRIYSLHKHNKIELVERWNMKHSLYALGGLAILVVNHPWIWENGFFPKNYFSFRVFNEKGLEPRFHSAVV